MISPKSTKILWASAAGRCSFTDCWEKLCLYEAGNVAPFTIGEMAHIQGDKSGSNRHDPSQSEVERNDYLNLILLCPTHHRLIDRKENELRFTGEILRTMKNAHEVKVKGRLDSGDSISRLGVAGEILIVLAENRASWAQYGPKSEIARKESNNEEVYAIWNSERLSVIVPNNRKIAEILKIHCKIFQASEQKAIASFLLHERSYERWVQHEIPYSAVLRFPEEFELIIKEVVNASA